MNTAKLLVLFVISIVATGSIVYQIRSRRARAPSLTSSQVQIPEPAAAPPAAQATAEPASAPAPAPVLAPVSTPAGGPEQIPISLPASGWGRNPFLTREEIDRANQPEKPQVVEAPPPRPAEPQAPPTYAVTAIVYGPNGSFAVVNSRVVQQGDRVGYEIVKEIKSGAVVLEYQGQIRELQLKKTGTGAQLAVPKGD